MRKESGGEGRERAGAMWRGGVEACGRVDKGARMLGGAGRLCERGALLLAIVLRPFRAWGAWEFGRDG